MNFKSTIIRFPGLDGIRAIACLLVLIGHLNYEMTKYFQQNISWKIFNADKEGVTIFFTLSGFIITFRILTHYQYLNNGIWKFIKNRAARILPLYFICLFTVSGLILIYNVNIFDVNKFLYYIFLLPNLLESGLPYLHHYWSLGVEEQFYILYPFALIFILKNSLKLKWILLFIIYLMLECIRIALYENEAVSKSVVNEFGFPFIILGCLSAIVYYNNHQLFSDIINNKVIQFCALAIMVCVLCINMNLNIFIHEIISFLAAIIIPGQVLIKDRFLKLHNRILSHIGKISFSIYVWHPLIIAICLKSYTAICITKPVMVEMIFLYLSIVAFTIFLANLSYKYIEAYFYFNKKALS